MDPGHQKQPWALEKNGDSTPTFLCPSCSLMRLIFSSFVTKTMEEISSWWNLALLQHAPRLDNASCTILLGPMLTQEAPKETLTLNVYIFSCCCHYVRENMHKVTTDLLAFVIFALPFIFPFLSAVAFEILLNYTLAANNDYILYIRILILSGLERHK